MFKFFRRRKMKDAPITGVLRHFYPAPLPTNLDRPLQLNYRPPKKPAPPNIGKHSSSKRRRRKAKKRKR